jgi:hypothetical protein
VTVPSNEAWTLAPATGAPVVVSGGQVWAQLVAQELAEAESAVSMYSVRPVLDASTVP